MNATPDYDAYFVSPEVERDRALALGLKWLLEQPGEPLVLLHAKKMVTNNRLLAAAVSKYHLRVEAPQTLWRSGNRWQGGAILAPWASAGVLKCIDDDLSLEASAVCVVGWRENDPNHQAWIAARNAVDLDSGDELGRDPNEIISDPVVRIAIDYASTFVNHNNALVQYDDKAYFIRTLEELVAGGHPFHLDEVVTYAMATGWTGEEIERIREYGQAVLAGRGFRHKSTVGPKRGDVRRWEDEAADIRQD
jgi:hypothetical protein